MIWRATVTAKDIIALAPCWSDDQVRAAVGRGVSYLEIARIPTVANQERLWVLTRLAARTPGGRNVLLLWAAGCAQDVRDLITDEAARDAADVCIAMVVSYVVGCATAQDCADAAAEAYAAAAAAANYKGASAAYAAADAAGAVANSHSAHLAAAHARTAAVYAVYVRAHAVAGNDKATSYAATSAAISEQQLVNLATALSEAAT